MSGSGIGMSGSRLLMSGSSMGMSRSRSGGGKRAKMVTSGGGHHSGQARKVFANREGKRKRKNFEERYLLSRGRIVVLTIREESSLNCFTTLFQTEGSFIFKNLKMKEYGICLAPPVL